MQPSTFIDKLFCTLSSVFVQFKIIDIAPSYNGICENCIQKGFFFYNNQRKDFLFLISKALLEFTHEKL